MSPLTWKSALERFAWLVVFLLVIMTHAGSYASTEAAQSYIQSADELLKEGDLRGAGIQLRNAIREAPEDGILRLRLGQIYLRLGEPVAAEATAIAAQERGVKDELIAPVLAEALLDQGEFGRLLKSVPASDRPAKIESAVRTLRGLAHLALGENSDAETMLRDAERLDPTALGPRMAMVAWLLRTGKLDEADQEADAALSISPDSSQALAAKGQVLGARGNSAGALEKFNAAIDRDPNNLRALFYRTGAYIQKGDLDGAQKDLNTILGRTPESAQANYLQAVVYATKGDLKAADDTLTKISGAFGRLAQAYYLAGVVKYRLGQLDLAEDYLNRYVAREPNAPDAYTMLAAVALRKGDTGRALGTVQKALNLAPDDVSALSLLGEIYLARRQTDKALAALEAASKGRPSNSALQAETALTRMERGETTAGISELEQVFRSDPKTPGVGVALVLSALRIGDSEKAAASAEDLVKSEPDNIIYQELLGMARFANRDLPGAEKVFRTMLDRHPDSAVARRNLSQIYVLTNRMDEARRLFDDALKRNSSDVDSLVALAEISLREDKTEDAARYLRRAQDAAPNSPVPGLRLISVYESKKDWNTALVAAQELNTQFQQDPNVADALARTQIESGDLKGALATYQHASEISAKSPGLLEHYAAALIDSKDFTKAREILRRALQQTPDSEQIKRQIVTVEYEASGLDAALAVAHSFTAADPGNPIGDILAAEVLVRDGKAVDAIKSLETILSNNPSSSVVAALSLLEIRAGDRDKSVMVLKQWLGTHPNDVALRMRLGQVYLDMRDYDAAQKEYEQLANERSVDAVVLNNLAWLYQRSGDPRAREVAERAYRIAPIPAVADTLGWVLTMQGGAESGVKYLTEASTAMPGNPDVQYHLAVALQKTGKVDDAREILRKIVALQADFDSKVAAKRLLAQLGGG